MSIISSKQVSTPAGSLLDEKIRRRGEMNENFVTSVTWVVKRNKIVMEISSILTIKESLKKQEILV